MSSPATCFDPNISSQFIISELHAMSIPHFITSAQYHFMKGARHFLTTQIRTKSAAPVLTELTEPETVSQF